MRAFVLCGLLLLVSSSVYATNSSSTATTEPSSSSATPPSTKTSDSTNPSDSTKVSDSTKASDSTKVSDSTKTSDSTNPSDSTKASDSTKDSSLTSLAVTTAAGSTGTPASTTTTTATTTTPIPITVKQAQVTRTCGNKRCKYLLQVPRLNQTFLNQQRGIYATDNALFAAEEASYENLANSNNTGNITEMFDALNTSVYAAINEYNRIQSALKSIPLDSIYINSSAMTIQSYVATLTTLGNTCLYDKCLKPKSTTTTTTTTTPPTTTPDPCKPDSCNCQANCTGVNGSPTCQPCFGNLANGQMCATSTCTPVGNSKPQNVIDYSWLVSPGYDIITEQSKGYGSNLACEWTLQFDNNYQYLALSPVFKSTDKPFNYMDSTAKLVMKCGGFSYTINSASSASKINGALKSCTVKTVVFTFTSGTIDIDKPYFGVQLILGPTPTPTPPPTPPPTCSPLSSTTLSLASTTKTP